MSKRSAGRGPQMAHQSGWALGLELRHLRAFVLLVDTGNLSAAARALGVAQSTMSEGIAALERAIGTRIVVRKRGERGMALTPAGEALLPHARRVLASLEDAHVAIAGVDHDMRTHVEVIANESISTYVLPSAMGEVRKAWPNVRFVVTVGACQEITEGVALARYDVGLGLMLQTYACVKAEAATDEATGEGVSVRIADVPLVLFSTPGHPLVSGPGSAPHFREQVAEYTTFISDSRGHFFDLLHDFFTADGVPNPKLEPAGSVEAVKRSVLTEGVALGILPHYAIADELRAGRLCIVKVKPELPRLRIESLAYRARPPAHPAVIALIQAVRRRLSQPAYPGIRVLSRT